MITTADQLIKFAFANGAEIDVELQRKLLVVEKFPAPNSESAPCSAGKNQHRYMRDLGYKYCRECGVKL
jgi:hypothetical protein